MTTSDPLRISRTLIRGKSVSILLAATGPLLGSAVFLSTPAMATPPAWQVGDFRTVETSGNGSGWWNPLPLGSGVLFGGGHPERGRCLWTTDGTVVGTQLVPQIFPGFGHILGLTPLVSSGSRVLVSASDGVSGTEPWITDGSPAGTFRLGDLRPGAEGSRPQYDAAFLAGHFWFTATRNGTSFDLFTSDGTPAGTHLVPGIDGNGAGRFAELGGNVYFVSPDGAGNDRLWVTDPEGTGATLVYDPGASGGGPWWLGNMVAWNGFLFFSKSTNPVSTSELWRSDGAAGGTERLETMSQRLSDPVPSGGKLFFVEGGRKLWVTDGAIGGANLLLDGLEENQIHSFFDGGGVLHFARQIGPYPYSNELWKSDGTAPGTILVRAFPAAPSASSIALLGHFCDRLWFSAYDDAVGAELWSSDGTPAGTFLVRDIRPGMESSSPFGAAIAGGQLFFGADDGVHGIEPWVTDGTTAGTRMIENLFPETADSFPSFLFDIGNGHLFFSALELSPAGEWRRNPWVTDGTFAGSRLLAPLGDLQVGGPATRLGTGIAFVGERPGNLLDLFWSDGTAGSLVPLLLEPAGNSDPRRSASNGALMLFSGKTAASGNELARTDGTPGGTFLVADLLPGDGSSNPDGLTWGAGRFWFFANDSGAENAHDLWTSDGTPAGTSKVKVLGLNGVDVSLTTPVVAGTKLFFIAYQDALGAELWVSDGTEAGTGVVKDIFPGAGRSVPSDFAVVGSILFFVANDGVSGYELWKSDGTEEGTQRVRDIWPGPGSAFDEPELFYPFPSNLAAIGGRLVFRAVDPEVGAGLWVSDGTEEGTTRVRPLFIGESRISWPRPSLFVPSYGNRFVFAAFDPEHGKELWESDGTPEGTRLLAEVVAGPSNGNPFLLTRAGNAIYFRADDLVSGSELWAVPISAPGEVAGLRASPLPGGLVDLEWQGSCLPAGDDFAVYEGLLGDLASAEPVWCSTGGEKTVRLLPGSSDRFFLVVPRGVPEEGSWGRTSAGIERIPPLQACAIQRIEGCP